MTSSIQISNRFVFKGQYPNVFYYLILSNKILFFIKVADSTISIAEKPMSAVYEPFDARQQPLSAS